MASKKPQKPAGGGGGAVNGKVILAAVGIALISGMSSFVAIRFAMPRQVIVEKHIITEKGKVVEDKKEDKKVEEASEIYPVGDFIVNLQDRHYLKTTVALSMAVDATTTKKGGGGEGEGKTDPGAAIKAEMAPFEPLYKDTIISTLSRQSGTRLQAPGGRDLVKDELKVSLNKAVPGKKVLGVYFTDFVIQ